MGPRTRTSSPRGAGALFLIPRPGSLSAGWESESLQEQTEAPKEGAQNRFSGEAAASPFTLSTLKLLSPTVLLSPKRSGILIDARTKCMHLEDTMLREVNLPQKDKYR